MYLVLFGSHDTEYTYTRKKCSVSQRRLNYVITTSAEINNNRIIISVLFLGLNDAEHSQM